MLLGKRVEKDAQVVFQTLEGHTFDSLKVLREIFRRQKEFMQEFCCRWGIDFTRFAKSAFVTVALHDVGKAIRPFQRNICQGKGSSAYPHAFYGIAVIHQLCRSNSYEPLLPDVVLEQSLMYPFVETLAVAAHHTQLHREIYQTIDKDAPWDEQVIDFLNSLPQAYSQYGFDELFPQPDCFIIPLCQITDFPMNAIQQFLREFCQRDNHHFIGEDAERAIHLKAIYTFLLALLKLSDITASIGFEDFVKHSQVPFKEPCGPVLERLADSQLTLRSLEELIPLNCSPYSYQTELIRAGERVMLLAPCGRGKTEAAVAWAVEQIRQHKAQRIVLAMPTQVTSNALRERLVKPRSEGGMEFPDDQVGLYHGRSFAEIKTRMAGETEDATVDLNEVREENFQGEVFWRPITVTTVDHLLYSFVHGFPQADFALGNLQTAAIIFDEVHYYERLLLSHLKLLFRTLRRMQIPHLLMSGTFPEFLKEEVQKDAGADSYVFKLDDEGMSRKPFQIICRSTKLVEQVEEGHTWRVSGTLIEEIVENHRHGFVQFIILNTVRRAKAVYCALKEHVPAGEIALLHSQFTYLDRRRKEKEILKRLKKNEHQEPYILIATQVIEVSLDISSNRMYTEVAPADALGQRAGRLNRGEAQPTGHGIVHELIVYEAESHLPYTEAETVIAQTAKSLQEGPISYEGIRKLCNQAYDGYTLGFSDLEQKFVENTLFGATPGEIRFSEEAGRTFRTRDEQYVTIDVIPFDVFDQLGEKALSADYLVSVPYWWLLKSDKDHLDLFVRHEVGERLKRYYLLCRVRYDDEIGFHDRELGTERISGVMI